MSTGDREPQNARFQLDVFVTKTKRRLIGGIIPHLPRQAVNQLRVLRGRYRLYSAYQSGAVKVSSPRKFEQVLGQRPVVVFGHVMGGGSTEILNKSVAHETNVMVFEGGVDGRIYIRKGSTNKIVGILDKDLNGKLDILLNSVNPRVVIVNHLFGHENWAAKISNIDATVVIHLLDRYWLTQIPFHLPGLSESIDPSAPGTNIRLNVHNVGEVPDSQWQLHWSSLLNRADVVFAPSFDLAKDYAGLTRVPISVEYPTHPDSTVMKVASKLKLPLWAQGDVLRIAVIGGGFPHKGSSDILRLVETSKQIGIPIHLSVFGGISPFSGLVPSEQIDLRGEFPRSELISCLRSGGFHFAWFPLRSPETYCMALDDAAEAGLFPVARAVGAVEEHLSLLGNGLVWDGEIAAETMIAEMVTLMERGDLKYFREPTWSPPAGMAPATYGAWNWVEGLNRENND